MKNIIVASGLCALTLLSSCSASNSGYVGKGQIAYEEKYIIVNSVNGSMYGTSDFGRYYIFHNNGIFEDILKDGNVFAKYRYYIDSAGDFYYQEYTRGVHNYYIWNGTISKECFTKIDPYYESSVYLAINENSKMYETFKIS